MAIINRYNKTLRGALYEIGNSLGLASTTIGVGNMTTATPAPPSGGTTTVFTSNSNSVNIQVPSGKVVYAELTWACASSTPSQTISPTTAINNSIFVRNPSGVTSTVAINPSTTQSSGTISPGQFASYTQSVEITTIIQNGGNGFYTLSQVPMVIGNTGGGFIITIVYEDSALPFRNINIWSLFNGPGIGSTVNIPLTGFSTPSSGNVTGRLTVGALAGNSDQSGDFVRFGSNVASAVTLSGPNNLANNFFASQINNNLGVRDTTGTFGNANVNAGSVAPAGVRVFYDTTNVNASSGLTNNQTSAVVVLGTSSDFYNVNSLGLQIDVNSAQLSPVTKISNNYFANIGDTITYTVTFGNLGLVEANDVVFIDTIPNGLSFISGSVNLNGTTEASLNPNPPGFNIGQVAPSAKVTISFKALVTTIPSPNPAQNQASLGYNFISAPGLTPIIASDSTNIVNTQVNRVDIASTKTVSKSFANVGDILTYTIVIGAFGNVTANSVVLVDTIPSGTTLVAGSLTQNNSPLAGNPNPPGVTLNNISKTGITTVSFKVKVDTIPNPNPIQNSATVTYTYLVDPTLARNDTGSSNTNIVNTQVNNANFGGISKLADKSFGDCGEVITYTIIAPNTGNVTAQNVVFKDTIPNGTVLVSDSVFVNGLQQTGANPSSGITIPNIGPSITATLTFSVRVIC